MMKRNMFKILFLAIIGAFVLGSAAFADTDADLIASGKAAGTVGEQCDGYLGLVPGTSASDALQAAVRATNIKRKAAYGDLASQTGTSIDDVARVTAEKLLERAQAGQKIRDCSGAWVIK